MNVKDRMRREGRTLEEIVGHYEVEKELASRLRGAPAGQRRDLYGQVYDELYRRVPSHPLVRRKAMAQQPSAPIKAVWTQLKFLRRFVNPDGVFMEVGAGSCILAREMARHFKQVY